MFARSYAVGVVAIVLASTGCSGDERAAPSAADTPAQQLVIPPMDAGAASRDETAAPAATEPPPPPEPATTDEMPPDTRDPRAKSAPRQRAVLEVEAQNLERLLVTTPATSSTRPHLLKRLTAAYGELARGASGADAAQARKQEAAHWTTLLNDHPSTAGLDEARYYRGLAYELSGEPQRARSSYYDLIKTSPQSKLVPYAYFAFGQMFFDDARQDPSKYALAEQAFVEVLKYPPPANGIFAYALLRLGETELALNQPAKAKAHFDRLRRDFPGSPATTHVPP
ncbi:MAG: tetratricopeptide repeat protein [Labilithrix sp.]|nr:tetratricopeptide repeat protein [Labilithrix sp.]MCW5812435.1 tetratricopeptide repeat protein [Labilithrix sp.]